MRVDVVFGGAGFTSADVAGRLVAVIDVLRASSSIAAALANGARAVIPLDSSGDAVERAKAFERSDVRLAGERKMLPIPGFDFGNSPGEFTRETVEGKTVIMTTTNGTAAIMSAQGARDVVIASYVNYTAVLAMLFCCVGDSITGFVGALMYDVLGARKTLIREYGRVMLPLRPASVIADVRHAIRHRKSPLLMVVMFISCAATGLIMYPALAPAFISAGAIGAVAADAFAWRFFGLTLNDDLTITLAAGGAMTLLAIL
jgi:hypothetical protein